MDVKKSKRKESKRRKKAALMNLIKKDDSLPDRSSNSSHATTSQKRRMSESDSSSFDSFPQNAVKRPCADSDRDKPFKKENDDEILDAYRKFLKRKRSMEQSLYPPRIYIDWPFLLRKRCKSLLFDDKYMPNVCKASLIHSCDVQSFIMYSLFKQKSLYRPKWCSIQHISSIKQILFLVLEGVSWLDVSLSYSSNWRNTNQLLAYQNIGVVSPEIYESSVEDDLFMVPLTAPEIANTLKKSADSPESSQLETHSANGKLLDADKLISLQDAFSRTLLLLPFTELVAESFPVPQHDDLNEVNDVCYADFVFSKDYYHRVRDSSPIFAIDCEMVLTRDDRYSLASICVVDERLKVIYKTLVKPREEIKNYLTKYSGITPELLRDTSTTLEDVQLHLKELLPPDAILCGHSLNNDLSALKLFHPYVIDTSVIYNLKGMPYSKSSLKHLASYFLSKVIQSGDLGHCPEEDALTTMELALLKLKTGFTFGNVLTDGPMITPEKFFKDPNDRSADNQCSHSTKPADDSTSNHLTEGSGNVSLDLAKVEQEEIYNVNVSQKSAFSRHYIPQLEVSMFDMIGQYDENTATICSQTSSFSQKNSSVVKAEICSSVKSTIKSTLKAIEFGTKFIYTKVAEPKDNTTNRSKKFAVKMDAHISRLWSVLKPGTLFCLLLSGTTQNHGSLMFAIKQLEATRNLHSAETNNELDNTDDVYATVYGV